MISGTAQQELIWVRRNAELSDECNRYLDNGIECITQLDTELSELKTILREYLAMGSSDGKNERQELRKRMEAICEKIHT